jgi:hypothetical protein
MSRRASSDAHNVVALSCAAVDYVVFVATVAQQHNSSLSVSPTPGDDDNRPKIKVFVVHRNVEFVASGADLSLVLVALVGGDQPAVTPEEFQAHLSSRFRVSVGTVGDSAWLGGLFARVSARRPL